MGAKEFGRIANEIFAPVYPVIAQEIIGDTGINRGCCIDLGSGPGHLGMALAQKSELEIILLDKKTDMLKIARKNIDDRNLGGRVKTLLADVSSLPLADCSVQLVASRGSLFFWDEPIRVFNEVYRVLAPGGAAVIGGSFGNPRIKREVDRKMMEINPKWHEDVLKRIGPDEPAKWKDILSQSVIPNFYIDHTPYSMWIKFVK